MDKINDKYGEFVITPALMMGMDEVILDWIAFFKILCRSLPYPQRPLSRHVIADNKRFSVR